MNRKFLLILGIISFCAFLIRIQVCRELLAADPQVASPSLVTDMYTYKTLSAEIADGSYAKVFYYQPFYYTVFLPAVRKLFGNGIWAFLIIQSILSALTVWFTGLAGAYAGGRRAGIIAALLLCFSTILILYVPYMLIATLQGFWVALIFYLCARFADRQRRKLAKSAETLFSSALFGAVTGCAILTRGNIWFFIPGILLLLIFAGAQNLDPLTEDKNTESTPVFFSAKYAAFSVCLFLIFMILPQIPFSVHNSRIKGEFTGPSTAAGAVLSLGNTPESPPGGRDPGTGPGPMEYPALCHAWMEKQEEVPVFRRIINWFIEEPAAFFELQFRKMLLFWDFREIPNNIALEAQGAKSPTLRTLGLLPVTRMKTAAGPRDMLAFNLVPMSMLILIPGFAGFLLLVQRFMLALFRRSWRKIITRAPEFILCYFILAYWLATSAFYILARFRMPAVPLLAVTAALFSVKFLAVLRKRKRKAAILLTLLLIFSTLTTVFGYDTYRYLLEKHVMKIVRPDGVRGKLADGRIMIRDNGPSSFGSWTPLQLEEGMRIQKRFSISANSAYTEKTAEFALETFWLTSGTLTLNIDGKNTVIHNPETGRKTIKFTVATPSDVRITVTGLNCRVYVFADMQREYGRTFINGKEIPGELAAAVQF